MRIKRYDYLQIVQEEKESDAVKLAVQNLKRDFRRVLDCNTEETPNGTFCRIVVGTLGISEEIEQKASTELLRDKDGSLYKEAFLLQEKDGELLIAGSDRRGTVYGIYEVCGTWLGVSPWYFFADVPVRQKEEICFEKGMIKTDHPGVEYRGVFINDEEELDKWVRLHMGEDTIGVRTYEKIFELLLRLKGNYIWPAMHVNSFNLKPENGALADRMGIVVGTSHCDMLMRSNNREWKPWLAKKGYTDVEYDYSIPGRNREILEEYWRESVQQNKDFEVSYTLGMRGIHDSGFETRSLQGLSGEELLSAKKELLETVIGAQERILKEELSKESLKTFVPYKEVLELYDRGLKVPEELTLIWANDNYGYIRRFPGEKEKKRKGGNGIYYHNSYWAPPGGSYLFICSIPLAHTKNELNKAWQEGIRKLWVLNIGALKPLEQEIAYFLQFAWEAGKEGALTQDVEKWTAEWIDKNFSGGHGKEMADVLNTFSQLTNVRKIEQMDVDTFSQTAYGDEASIRLNRYVSLFERTNAVYDALPGEEKDAFFQLCVMKVHAAFLTNAMYYYADRSSLCVRQGRNQAAAEYVRRCRAYDDARRRLLKYYGEEMSGGKWSGIVTPEDFPPPRTAMYPACVPPLSVGEAELVVDCWNEEEGITFVKDKVKWIQLANAGAGRLTFSMDAPEWISLSETEGQVEGEKRVLVRVKTEALRENGNEMSANDGQSAKNVRDKECGMPLTGVLTIRCAETGQCVTVPMAFDFSHAKEEHLEDGGMLWAAACDARELCGSGTDAPESGTAQASVGAQGLEWCSADAPGAGEAEACTGTPEAGSTQERGDTPAMKAPARGWKRIPRLGRGEGDLAEAREEGAALTYSFYTTSAAPFTLEVHRFPSLNSTGRIRVFCSVDGGERLLLESEASDEWRGSWKQNIRDNVDRLTAALGELKPGRHTLRFYAKDKYFAFSKWVLYAGARKENMLGGLEGNPSLPDFTEPEDMLFYGKLPLLPRPVIYAPLHPSRDSLLNEDTIKQPDSWGKTIRPEELLRTGEALFAEENGSIRIDAAAALAQTRFAFTQNREWDYCSSESYGRSGLAMHIRKSGLTFSENLPALSYRFVASEGTWRVWILVKCNSQEDSHFTVGFDDETESEDRLCDGRGIWRYSAEQVYRWMPVLEKYLEQGEHLFHIYALCSGTRFDRIYLTKGEELPPADAEWGQAHA